VRVALWRALHIEVDPPPHVLEDSVGLELAAPEDGWRQRPDMDPDGTRLFRASIVARARFVEDLLAEKAAAGVDQYVILGAGLDSFAQRRADLTSRLTVFEVDRPGPQRWKRQRLEALGYGVPPGLRLVPVDFERGGDWIGDLVEAGFDPERPAVVSALGLSMYLDEASNADLLHRAAALGPGSTFVMGFLVPLELADDEVRPGLEMSAKGARASGTPFLSYFRPEEALALAGRSGFAEAQCVSGEELARRYFLGRADGLHPPRQAEELLVANT
jgi:methyltransferase (TIGR00027 family)